jgi:PIN domain nuclease of toxin-antitoxin system
VRLLLDTHAVLWWYGDDRRLGEAAAEQLGADDNAVLLSAVAVWEISIKRSAGKLDAPADLVEKLLVGGAQALPVSIAHAAAAADLPLHHADPFDRLLVAQARIENAVLVSRDRRLAAYGVPVLW